jgi:O-antigen/teichoic acid export membrane protein
MSEKAIRNFKNVAIVSIAAYIEYFAGFLTSVLIARSLGPSGFGSYAFLVWLVGQMAMFMLHGVNVATIKYVGRLAGTDQQHEIAPLVRWLRKITFCSAAFVIFLYACGAQFLPIQELPFSMWLSGAFIVIASSLRSAYRFELAFAQAMESYKIGAIAQSIGAVSFSLMAGVLFFANASLVYYLGAYLVVSLTQYLLIALRTPALTTFEEKPTALSSELRSELRRNIAFGAQFVLISSFSWGAVEVYLLKLYAPVESVAYFSVALTLGRAAMELSVGGFASTLNTSLAKLMGKDSKDELASVLSNATSLFSILGVLIGSLAVVALPGFVLLFYGPKYEPALPYVSALTICIAMYMIFTPLSAYQMVNDRPAERMRLSLFAALVNVGLAFVLIPKFLVAGAVFCFGANMLLYGTLGWFLVRRNIKLSLKGFFFVKLGFAAIICISVSLPISIYGGRLGFVPATLTCIFGFITSATALKVFPSEYFLNAERVFRKLFGISSRREQFILKVAQRFSS